MEVEIDALILALEDHSLGVEWFVDSVSGEVIPVTDRVVTDDLEGQGSVAADPARYLPIAPMPSHEAFQIMEAFVATVASPRVQKRLEDSLRRPHPFRAFKSALLDLPEEREAWFRFHEEQMTVVARRWLAEAGMSGVARASVRPKDGI